MFHYFGTVTNTRGDSLAGWSLEVRNGDAVVPIYSDDGVTPLPNNRAVSDAQGNADFYVTDGVYNLRYYDVAGTLQRTELNVPMLGGSGVYVQAGEPTAPGPYVWLKTDGSTRARLFVEDGV